MEAMNKVLSNSDTANKRLEFPVRSLRAFPMPDGQNSMEFVLGNPTGDVLIIAQGRVKHTETIFYVVRQIRLHPRESLYY
jgi:hypothetical protein